MWVDSWVCPPVCPYASNSGGVYMARSDVVPIWEKANLSMEEAAAYFGIGINKLREMTNEDNCPFVLWNGSKRMIKRKAFEKFLEADYSI